MYRPTEWSDVLAAFFCMACLAALFAAAVGWVLNIVKLVALIDSDGSGLLMALRASGILIAPLGAILGFY